MPVGLKKTTVSFTFCERTFVQYACCTVHNEMYKLTSNLQQIRNTSTSCTTRGKSYIQHVAQHVVWWSTLR